MKASQIEEVSILPGYRWEELDDNNLQKKFSRVLPIPILTIAPCYRDMLNVSRMEIYTLKKPEYPFSKKIYDITERI